MSGLIFAVAASQELPKSVFIGTAMVPGAFNLGTVEVKRRIVASDVFGWSCGGNNKMDNHLYYLEQLRRGYAPVPLHIAADGPQAIDDYQTGRQKELEIDAVTWTLVLGKFAINGLTAFSESKQVAHEFQRANFLGLTWRGWLRITLEKINSKADKAGMSAAAKEQALRNWLMCHIGKADAERLRRIIDGNRPPRGEN
ncbi:MAG: hypothetical protein OXG29_12775 [Gammaproteobacteria bacterium]|nr:hypothetical protein [Gammaproteobacteria bacterium]MCY3987851.1 hypothetical protein [Gammaproteobacteria bacterium]